MKTLIVLRHAKAEASSPDGQDIHRPLSERGRKDAERAGKALRKMDAVPDRVLCSPSTRTRETVESLMDKLKASPPVAFEDSIYEASSDGLMQLLRAQEGADRILLVGHNPGLEEFASRLASGSAGAMRFSTCAMARIDFEFDDWRALAEGSGKLAWLLDPDVVRRL